MANPTTIAEVIQKLDIIIEEAISHNSRLGIFAYVYRRTTAEVLKQIESGNFEDNGRMEKMDVAFANLYLNSVEDYKNNRPVRKSWELAFKSEGESLTILQHIMLGMNAHINLDLGIAASAVMMGQELLDIENDFNKINDILQGIINEMQDRLGKVSPFTFLLDIVGKNSDERIIDFSLRKAREQSWNNANLLWALGDHPNSTAIQKMDLLVTEIGKLIKSPRSKIINLALRTIGRFEEKNIGTVISKLRE